MADIFLHTHDLTLSVPQKTLVQGLHWEVKKGECWCIIGQNGIGKTTLLRSLAGLVPAHHRQIMIQNRALAEYSWEELARLRAYLSQTLQDRFSCAVLDWVTAARYVYRMDLGVGASGDIALAKASLTEVDCAHLLYRKVGSLSGGERQRVALGAILAQRTPMVLLDEPIDALDVAHQMQMMAVLKKNYLETNGAIIMVSHDINWAAQLATHVLLLMKNGQWMTGKASELLTSDLLTNCLGYPIIEGRIDEQIIFMPKLS